MITPPSPCDPPSAPHCVSSAAEAEWFKGVGLGPFSGRGSVVPGEEAEVDRLACLVEAYRNEARDVQEQLFAARAELAYMRMGGEGERFNRDLTVKSKVEEYERTVGLLRAQIKEVREGGELRRRWLMNILLTPAQRNHRFGSSQLQGRTVGGELERDRAGLKAVAEQYFTDSESDEDGDEDVEGGVKSREDAMADHLDDIDHTIRAKEEVRPSVTPQVPTLRRFLIPSKKTPVRHATLVTATGPARTEQV